MQDQGPSPPSPGDGPGHRLHVDDGREAAPAIRLLTTMIDHVAAPALDLAAAYTQRWEIESVLDELKTHQRGPRAVLRSQSPELVRQEIWEHLCCHYAIRALMFDAATTIGRDPDRVSFVAALRIESLVAPSPKRAPFPPEATDTTSRLWRHAIRELARRLLPARRPRANPRVVKSLARRAVGDVSARRSGRMAAHRRSTVANRVSEHRRRRRALGLRPVQIWIPDVRAADFADEAHRQSAAVAASDHAGDDQGFIDAVSDDEA